MRRLFANKTQDAGPRDGRGPGPVFVRFSFRTKRAFVFPVFWLRRVNGFRVPIDLKYKMLVSSRFLAGLPEKCRKRF